jgi:hypothetical protein
MMSPRAVASAACVLAFVVAYPQARADRYEATVSVRPDGALARVDDAGVRAPAMVAGGGLSAGLSWGVRNWLDVGAELAALVLSKARYEGATADVAGTSQMGELSRTTRLAQLRGAATLRLGVGWVPTVRVVAGAGVRQRSAAHLVVGPSIVVPDGEEATFALDAVVGVRVGLDHRLTRRWSLGLSAGATAYIGIGAPSLQVFDAGLALAYTWYPLW